MPSGMLLLLHNRVVKIHFLIFPYFINLLCIQAHNLSNNLKSQLLFTILGFTLFMTLE